MRLDFSAPRPSENKGRKRGKLESRLRNRVATQKALLLTHSIVLWSLDLPCSSSLRGIFRPIFDSSSARSFQKRPGHEESLTLLSQNDPKPLRQGGRLLKCLNRHLTRRSRPRNESFRVLKGHREVMKSPFRATAWLLSAPPQVSPTLWLRFVATVWHCRAAVPHKESKETF